MHALKHLAFVAMLSASAVSAQDAASHPFSISPWQLGMTPEQVSSMQEFGPYSPVKVTGGLETGNAQFMGAKTNVSFVFDGAGLQYIQVWKYEGKDDAAAQAAVVDLFRLFATEFGGAEVGNVEVSGPDGLTEESLKVVLGRILGTARALAKDIKKKHKQPITIMFDMMPKSQPTDSRLHSQWGYSSKYDTFYVFLFQDRTTAAPRQVEANVHLGDP